MLKTSLNSQPSTLSFTDPVFKYLLFICLTFYNVFVKGTSSKISS